MQRERTVLSRIEIGLNFLNLSVSALLRTKTKRPIRKLPEITGELSNALYAGKDPF